MAPELYSKHTIYEAMAV